MAKKTKGPVFLRYVAPIVETLKELGGSGSAEEVTDMVIARIGLSAAEQAETTASGQLRVRNQIGWARFYLTRASMLQAARRGVWTLTRKGWDSKLENNEEAVYLLFKNVQNRFKKVVDNTEGADPLPDEEEQSSDVLESVLVTDSGEAAVEAEREDGGEAIHKPYDPSKMHIITKTMSIEQLAKRIRHGEIDMLPGFQRMPDLWKDDKKSLLIESMLIRIPLPVFYFDATDDTKWLVVDGLQRLSTIRHFMEPPDQDKRLRLQGLEYLRQHEGKTFLDLPRDLQRRIEETQIFAHLIQPGTPVEVKFNIFRRINTGGLVLTDQEIRHTLFQKTGGATQLLRELADSPEFVDATDRAIPSQRMLDCEFVLRFVAFSLTPHDEYTEPDMDAFLNRHMQRLDEEGAGSLRDDLRRRFSQAMRAAQQIFGSDAFRKPFAANERRKPINKALFEAWSVALGNLDHVSLEKLVARKGRVRRALIDVLGADRAFDTAISQATGGVKHVAKRFSTVENIIRQILRDPA